jgi:hypothetical protein
MSGLAQRAFAGKAERANLTDGEGVRSFQNRKFSLLATECTSIFHLPAIVPDLLRDIEIESAEPGTQLLLQGGDDEVVGETSIVGERTDVVPIAGVERL